MAFDLYFFQIFRSLAEKNWVIDALSVFFAKYVIFILVFAAIFLGWRMKDWRHKFYFFALSLASLFVSRGVIFEILNYAFRRERPADYLDFEPVIRGSGFSFPSGHATFLFTLAFCVWIFNKKWGSIFIALSFLVGISRIIVGAHWPTDVIFGAIIASFIPFLLKPLFFKEKENPRLN